MEDTCCVLILHVHVLYMYEKVYTLYIYVHWVTSIFTSRPV